MSEYAELLILSRHLQHCTLSKVSQDLASKPMSLRCTAAKGSEYESGSILGCCEVENKAKPKYEICALN